MVSHADRSSEDDLELVELARYPNKTEIDLLLPLLEEADIPADCEELVDAAEPAGAMRLLVASSDLEEAQRIYEAFEAERLTFRMATEPDPGRAEQSGREGRKV